MKEDRLDCGLLVLARTVSHSFKLGVSARCVILMAGVSSLSILTPSVWAADSEGQSANKVITFSPVQGDQTVESTPITDDGGASVSVVQNGAGKTILSAVNTYTGQTTIKQGTLALSDGGSIAQSSGVVMNGSGNFDISGANSPVSIKSLSGSSTDKGVILGRTDLNITSAGVNDILDANLSGSGSTVKIDGNKQGFRGNITGNINFVFGPTGVDMYIQSHNDYTGETSIKGSDKDHTGSLNIYGINSTGSSHVTIGSYATVDGSGSFGAKGNSVDVQNDGTIQPGNGNYPLSVLTVNGTLNTEAGSFSNFTISDSHANKSGKPQFSMVHVKGDLNLNGVILTSSNAGQLGTGVRTLYTYDGNLSHESVGLSLSGVGLQSDISALQMGNHQVNLIESNSGDKLSYWDGSHTTSTGQVEGGAGIWKQGDSAATNWTGADGQNNAAWNKNDYAIFQHGNNDSIAVDGPVNVGGMQFTTNYTVDPNKDSANSSIILNGHVYGDDTSFHVTNKGDEASAAKEGLLFNSTGSASIIRVGDGSLLGAGQTATINTTITDDASNPTSLVKTDAGTLVLNQVNSYTGGTVVTDGVLQIASEGSLGKLGTALDLDGGTLRLGNDIRTNRTIILGPSNYGGIDLNNHTYNVDSSIVGPGGQIEVWGNSNGPSVMNLNKDNTYTGNTNLIGSQNYASFMPNTTINANDSTPFGTSNETNHGGAVYVGNVIVNMNGSSDNNDQADLGYHSVTIDGSDLNFNHNSTADHATIENQGGYGHSAVINFNDDSTAGSSTITNNNGGILNFNHNSTADSASVKNNGGSVDISQVAGNGLSIGSLSGNGGTVSLGSKILTIGGLNNNDTLASTVQDGGAAGGTGGSIVKIGTGTQTLTGENSYTGSTIIKDGTLALAGSGSIAQSSYLDVEKEGVFDISQATSVVEIKALRGEGDITLGKNTLNITNADPKNKYLGHISGEGGLTITSGEKNLDNVNSFKGLTDVKQGAALNLSGSVGGDLSNEGITNIVPTEKGQTSVVGDVTNSGTLNAQNATLNNIKNISGTSTFNKSKVNNINNNGGETDLNGTTAETVTNKKGAIFKANMSSDGSEPSVIASANNEGDMSLNNTTMKGDLVNVGTLATQHATLNTLQNQAGTTTLNGGTANSLQNDVGAKLILQNDATTESITNKGSVLLDDSTVQNTLANDGDLTVGKNGATVGTVVGNGDGTLNGTLTLMQAQGTYSGVFSGDGGLTVAGGSETLTGQNSYRGDTTIQNGGTLEVDGAVVSNLTHVQQGGTLRGTGTVGSTVVDGGGLVSPGAVANQAVPATLHVNGDLSMAQGSILRIHGTSDMTGQSLTTAKGDGYHELTSDRLAVTGKASLAGGTLDLIVKNAGAGLTYGQAYRVLTATQGVSGQFSGLTTNLAAQYAYLDPTLAYSADAVDIVLKRNGTGFGDVGGTRNEVTAGQGVSHVGAGSGLVTALTGLTKDQARRALDNLSGELHASIRTALIQDSFYIRNAVINRLANADCDYGRNGQSVYDLKTHKKNGACYSDHAVLWGQAYGGLGHNSGDGNAALMHHNTAGFIVGADAPINHSNWRVGGLLSYGHSQFNVERGRSSSGNSNNISVGAYAGTHWGRLNLRLGADYSWNVINTRRQIAVGDYGSRVRSSYLGGTAQAYAELGYKLRAGHTVFEPFMNVAYINMQTNSFREHGNDAALRSRGTDQGVTFSTFGFRAATRVNIGKAVFMPHIMAGYRHGFGRLRPGLHEGFVAGGGTSTMDVAGVLLSQDAAVTDAGITAQVTDRIGVDLSYIGQYGNHSIESGATGSVKVSF